METSRAKVQRMVGNGNREVLDQMIDAEIKLENNL